MLAGMVITINSWKRAVVLGFVGSIFYNFTVPHLASFLQTDFLSEQNTSRNSLNVPEECLGVTRCTENGIMQDKV
jgi:hypothetical protein